MKTKQEKYNEKYPIVASYKGWVIRSFAAWNIEIKEEAINLFMEYLNNILL